MTLGDLKRDTFKTNNNHLIMYDEIFCRGLYMIYIIIVLNYTKMINKYYII